MGAIKTDMKRQNIINDILNALTSEWQTYRQLSVSTGHKVGVLAAAFNQNIYELEDKLLWDHEVFGDKEWQMRMVFKKV